MSVFNGLVQIKPSLFILFLFIKRGVECVEVFAVEVILYDSHSVEETVRVKYFDIYISNAESIKL